MKMVAEWRSAWRWYSVNCPALAAALLASWSSLPDEWRAAFTQQDLKVAAILLISLGIGGRLVDQKKV